MIYATTNMRTQLVFTRRKLAGSPVIWGCHGRRRPPLLLWSHSELKKTSPTVNIPFSFLLAKSIFCSFELNQIIMWSDKYHGEGKVRLSCRREGRRNAFLSGEELLIQPSHLMEIQPQDLLPKPLQRRAKLVLPCLEQGRAGFAQTFVGLNCRGCRILYPAVLFSW